MHAAGRIVTVTAANNESVRLNIVSKMDSLRTAHRMAIGATGGLLDCTLLARVVRMMPWESMSLVISNSPVHAELVPG